MADEIVNECYMFIKKGSYVRGALVEVDGGKESNLRKVNYV